MKKKNIILSILAVTVVLSGLAACKKNPNTSDVEKNPNQNVISGELNQNQSENEKKEIDNNGGSFVYYKGKTYYREYNNTSIEKVALNGEFYYETGEKTSKFINVILENGTIKNLFKDEGYGDFYISNDRFFLRGQQNKLYSVNMEGEDFREICRGYYLSFDEKKQDIYYINTQNNNAMYKINTESLQITKVTDEIFGTPYFVDNKIYYYEFDESNNTRIMQIDMDSNLTTQIALIENADKDYGEYYYVASKVIHNNKMFLSIGYDSGTIGAYTDSKLYCVDLTSNDLKLLDTNVTKEFKLHNNSLYYQEYSLEEMVSTVKKVDLDTLKITEINNSNGEINITDNLVTDRNGEVVYIDGIYSTNKVLVSKEDKDEFKEKYAVNLSENDILIQVREVQKVNNKIYFLLEISKHNPDGDIGWRESYERIASEMYSYDLSNDTKSLVYLYKATDLIENMSGDSSANDEEVLAPLGENEMYLDIRLKDKGLKDTFDVRVEEVGGLIIGKRIEYEGTHSRAEEMITIKVTKEIGAMLSVYIDDKLDSQMLITEE